jgi:phosphoribosylanthranilate isomerase
VGVARTPTRIKFCGITRPSDAEHALELGAWAVGLIFYPRSPRRIEMAAAAEIAGVCKRRAELVGVFVNPTLEYVTQTAEALDLPMIQLHGDEGPSFCGEIARRTGARVIKAARVHSGADIQALAPFHTDFHLLDSFVSGLPGGTGETFAWDLARAHGRSTPVILSGGLTPENVGEAIATVRPYAVDVASGVEFSPGRKDPAKLDAFARAVALTNAEEVVTP